MATFAKRDGKWQAQVRKVGARSASKTFETLAAARRWATSVERAIDSGEWHGGRVRGTLGDLVRRYREESTGEALRPVGRSKAAVLNKLEAELGAVRLADLTAERVIAFARKRKKEGAGPVTVGVDLAYLAGVLRTAKALWRLPVTAAPVVEAREALRLVGEVFKSRARERRPSAQELARILAHLRARPHGFIPAAEIAEFALATGMRLGEIVRVRWDDLDEAARTVVIRDRKDPRRKAGRHETVPLLTVTGLDPLPMVLARPREDPRIWPYEGRSVSAAWTRACRELKVADLHFHDLRAEFTSRAFEAGMSIEQVALCTGHRDWAVLKRYARLRPGDLVSRFAPAPPATPPAPPPGRTSADPT